MTPLETIGLFFLLFMSALRTALVAVAAFTQILRTLDLAKLGADRESSLETFRKVIR